MSIIKDLEKDIKNIIAKAGYNLEKFTLQPSSRPDLGDYQINDAMSLAKTYHKNPHEIAEDIKNELEKDAEETDVTENTIDPEETPEESDEVLEAEEKFGVYVSYPRSKSSALAIGYQTY